MQYFDFTKKTFKIFFRLNILIFETTHEIMDNHKELENKEIALHETSDHHHMAENSNFTRLWDPNR